MIRLFCINQSKKTKRSLAEETKGTIVMLPHNIQNTVSMSTIGRPRNKYPNKTSLSFYEHDPFHFFVNEAEFLLYGRHFL